MPALAAKSTQAAQACLRGHPRLTYGGQASKTWMAGTSRTSPAMTASHMLRRGGDHRGLRLRGVGAAQPVEERVEDDRHDGGEQDTGFQQRMQGVRRVAE